MTDCAIFVKTLAIDVSFVAVAQTSGMHWLTFLAVFGGLLYGGESQADRQACETIDQVNGGPVTLTRGASMCWRILQVVLTSGDYNFVLIFSDLGSEQCSVFTVNGDSSSSHIVERDCTTESCTVTLSLTSSDLIVRCSNAMQDYTVYIEDVVNPVRPAAIDINAASTPLVGTGGSVPVGPTSTVSAGSTPSIVFTLSPPSSTVLETSRSSSVPTSCSPTDGTNPPSAMTRDLVIAIVVCVVLFIIIATIIIIGLLFMRRRNRRRRDREPQDIPMNRQGTPQASNHTAVEETGGELQGPPSSGGGGPTTTVLGLLSQCAIPSEEDVPTEPEQPTQAFPPTEDRSAPVLDVSPHNSVELPRRTLVSEDPDDGDVKSSTVFKKCTNESVLSSNHKLAIEDVKTATLHPQSVSLVSAASFLRSDILSEPISLTQTPSLVLPSQPPSSCLSLNSPPTDSALPPNSPPTDSSLPPNSPPTDSSLPPNSPPTDSSPTKAALADTESDDSGISSGDSEGSGGSGSEDDDQDSDGASGENTSACPESWCDAVLCNEIAPVEEQIITGNQDSTPPNQENGGEENESGGDIVYTTQLKKSRRLSRTHDARSRKDRVGPLERAGNTVNLTLSNSEWKPFAMNPELLQRDTMLLYAFDDINGLGSTVYQTAVQ